MKTYLKTIRFLLLRLLCITVIFSACKEDEDIFLTGGTTPITFEGEGGEQNLRFDCNSSWWLSCDATWLSFSAKEGVGKGIVPVICETNNGDTPRTADIYVYAGDQKFTISVTQQQTARHFGIEAEDFTAPAKGGIFDLTVSGNVYFMLKNDIPWIEQMISADVPSNILRISIAPNYLLTDREIKLIAGDPKGLYQDSIIIRQPFMTESRTTDSLALVALYKATSGANWTRHWDLSQPITQWDGIELSSAGEDARVTRLLLWQNNMNGQLPGELDYLTQLNTIHLANNQLEGPIPAYMAKFTKLELLALQNNNFSGTIPVGIGSLPLLTAFYADHNKLEGEIPADILNNVYWANWKNSDFCTQQNGFGFTNIDEPEDIETTEKNILLAVYESTNGTNWLNKWDASTPITNWHGVVTEVIDGKIRVKELNLWDNQMSGTLPDAIGGLSECVQIHIGGNAVSGNIPAGLGNLTKLQLLGLQGNQFTGSVPSSIGALQNLSNFFIDGNRLSGEIPAEILSNPNWNNWKNSGFCNQNGTGFTNCQ